MENGGNSNTTEIKFEDSEGEEMVQTNLSTVSTGTTSAQRRWSLNFSRNKKFLYQKTVSFKPSRRLRRKILTITFFHRHNFQYCFTGSFDTPMGSQKLQSIDTITEDFEQHEELMENSQLAEQLRIQTIRSLPQTLFVKREIRSNLSKTIGRRSSSNTTGDFWRYCKNYGKLLSTQVQRRIEHTGNRFEMWYDSLKAIEGHFGSSVGAYFRFLRFLYITNVIVAVFMIAFVAFPQFLFNNTNNPMLQTANNSTKSEKQILLNQEINEWAKYDVVSQENISEKVLANNFNNKKSIESTEPIQFWDIFTALVRFNFISVCFISNLMNLNYFQHGFKSSIMFYGSYTNETFALKVSNFYSMPHAYLITTSVLYTLVFTIVSLNVARSYRRSFIESSGAIHKLFSHRILCAWDFNLCFIRGAKMKRDAIVQDFRELLAGVNAKGETPETNLRRFYVLLAQLTAHILVLLLLSGVSIGVWMLLLSRDAGKMDDTLMSVFYLPIAVNLIVSFFQNVFGWVSQ